MTLSLPIPAIAIILLFAAGCFSLVFLLTRPGRKQDRIPGNPYDPTDQGYFPVTPPPSPSLPLDWPSRATLEGGKQAPRDSSASLFFTMGLTLGFIAGTVIAALMIT